MPDPITWKAVIRKISDLIPWPRNPRQIDQEQGNRLLESWEEFGQVETIAIGPANEVYNGHQRLKVLGARFGGDFSVECRQSSRPLTEKEREKLTVFLHRGTVGDWDWDALANLFESQDLIDWGFKKEELGIFEGVPNLDELREQFGEPGERDFWPVIKIQVSPETKTRFDEIFRTISGIDEADRFSKLLDQIGV